MPPQLLCQTHITPLAALNFPVQFNQILLLQTECQSPSPPAPILVMHSSSITWHLPHAQTQPLLNLVDKSLSPTLDADSESASAMCCAKVQNPGSLLDLG